MKIAVYGASGYQGGLVTRELARRRIAAVLVGRDAVRLRDAAGDGERRVADTDDHDAMVSAFAGADAVINCAGPFTVSGESVIRAAVVAGCHYVDTAGEQPYILKVFETVRAPVTVMPAATDAGVPCDLVAHLLAAHVGPIDELTVAHVITGGGGPSRGSLRSLVGVLDSVRAGGLTFDGGAWRAAVAGRHRSIAMPGTGVPIEMVPFPLPEVVTVPRHVDVQTVAGYAEAALGTRLGGSVTAAMIDALPVGPSEEERGRQCFTYVLDAVARDGRSARGVVRGTDTYGTTAVIAVEAARRLVADGAAPGVLASAQAFDAVDFLTFLQPFGLQWTVEEDPRQLRESASSAGV